MSSEIQKEQETLLQTIQARLERAEDGSVKAVYDPNGPWTICERTSGGLVTRFTPAYQPSIDKYGNQTENE